MTKVKLGTCLFLVKIIATVFVTKMVNPFESNHTAISFIASCNFCCPSCTKFGVYQPDAKVINI